MKRRSEKRKAAKRLDAIDRASVPIFVVTMLVEAAVLRRREQRRFGDLDQATAEELSDPRLPPDQLVPVGFESRDTAASLAMLGGNVVFDMATAAALGRTLRFLSRHRVVNLGDRRGSFVVSLVLWDFLYYWNHRWMHEVRLFWANHVSHHSSERYNLSTALRQPWSGFLLSWVFMPLPVVGLTAAQARRARQINLLYQYWIHTEAIDRFPRPVEAVFNTPSHHRVHHGANPQYLDKNYGGIFITWDKLFGTFEPEVRRVKYGLTKNITTHNPARIAYHEFADIGRDVVSARGWRNKLGHVFHRPGWSPKSPPADHPSPE